MHPARRRPSGPLALGIAWLASALVACHLTIDTSDLQGGCRSDLAGPALVQVESSSLSYCVDSTEVTNAQYKVFVDSRVTIPTAPGCEPIATYMPNKAGWPLPGTDDFPVVEVNWCQAQAYCKWSGKRLCGRIRGGPLAKVSEPDPDESQWLNACTHGGTLDFPYGHTYDDQACAGPPLTMDLVSVSKYPSCQGGFAGLFDMSGNVWEWADTCDAQGANPVSCRSWGGAYDSAADEFACDKTRNWAQLEGAWNIGFRCCMDL